MSYLASEASVESGSPIEIYDFLIGAEHFRHTTGEEPVTVDGEDYSPLPIIRDSVSLGGADPQEFTVTIPASHQFVRQYINSVPGNRATLTLRRFHRFDPAQEVAELFRGRVAAVRFEEDGLSARISVTSLLNARSRSIPLFVYSSLCNHVLGRVPSSTTQQQLVNYQTTFAHTSGDLNGQGNWEEVSWSTSDASWLVTSTPSATYSFDVAFSQPTSASAQNVVDVADLDTTKDWQIVFKVKFFETAPFTEFPDLIAPGALSISIGNADGSTQWQTALVNEIGGFAFPLVLSGPEFTSATRDDVDWPLNLEITFTVTFTASTGTMEIKQGSTSLLSVSDIPATVVAAPLLYMIGTNCIVTYLSITQTIETESAGISGCPVDLDEDVSPMTNDAYPDGIPFVTTGEVVNVVGNVYTVSGANQFPDGWFKGGFVKVNGSDYRLVLQHTGNILKLLLPFSAELMGQNVSVYAGCDHSLPACRAKFNQVPNYGGYPWVPTENPFKTGLG